MSHVAVGVRDMETALGFYRDVLGLRVTADKIEEFSQGPGQPPAQRRAVYLRYQDGPHESFIVLDQQITNEIKGQPAELFQMGVHHFAFWVDDIDGMMARVRDAGVTVLMGGGDGPGADTTMYGEPAGGHVRSVVPPGSGGQLRAAGSAGLIVVGSGTSKVATFDHVTVAVFDLDEAIQFFGVLGFEVIKNVRISGATMDAYMGIPGMEADHVTLAIPDAEPHQEVQLLHFHKPSKLIDRSSGNLAGTGFNHICFRVEDLDATVAAFESAGFPTRNQAMDFHDRKLVFLIGPANTVVELAQWE